MLLLAVAFDAGAAERLLTAPAYDALHARFEAPAIATDGSSFLAAWIATPPSRNAALMVRRLDASATVLPTVVVTDPGLRDGGVDLVWSNGSYLLVWNSSSDLHAMRLRADGQPVAGSERVLATDLRSAVVVANDAVAIVVARSASEIVRLTLDSSDGVAKRSVIAGIADIEGYDAVARDSGFTIAIITASVVAMTRLDTAGNPLDAAPRTIVPFDGSNRSESVALGSRGDDTLLVWSSFNLSGAFMPSLLATVISPSGNAGTTAALPHSGFISGLDVAGDARGYTVLVSGTPYESAGPAGFVEAVDVGADGTPAAASRGISFDGFIDGSGRLARNATGFGVVWKAISESFVHSTGQIVEAERIQGGIGSTLESAATPILLSRGTTEQRLPAIASNGSGYLVAWVEIWLTSNQVMAAPLDHNGAPAALPIALSRAALSSMTGVRVVYGGVYLVTWINEESLWAMRLDANGHPLDAAPILLSGTFGGNGQYDVTATADGFFAAWHTWQGSVYGAALTSAGPTPPQKLTEHAPGSTAHSLSESDPHLGFNGDRILLAYSSWQTFPCTAAPPCPEQRSWEMVRLDAAGHRLDSDLHPLAEAVLSIASDGRDFAVLQRSDLLRIDGRTLAVTARLDVTSSQRPALVWNGARYVVVTVDDDAGGAAVTARDVGPQWTLGGTRTTAIEPLLDSADFAANGAGDVFAAYARGIAEEPFLGALRAAVQPVGDIQPARRRAAGRP